MDQDEHQDAGEEGVLAEILPADPDEATLDPVHTVDGFIENSEWHELEEYLVNIIPNSQDGPHPSLVHPMLFLIIWRRQLKDFIKDHLYEQAEQILAQKISPLKLCKTPYAYSEKLSNEINRLEHHIGKKERFEHWHCGTPLMKNLVIDYLRLYLPDSIGYVRPKKKHSAMWEFVVRLDIPKVGVKRHPDVRCLVCSQVEYFHCNVGVRMTEHLKVCPGFTPEALGRYTEAVRKESQNRRPDTDNNRNKTLKLAISHGASSSQGGPLQMLHQKVEEAKLTLVEMKDKQQDPEVISKGIHTIETILGNLSGLFASALQHVPPTSDAKSDTQVPPAPNAAPPHVPSAPNAAGVLNQALPSVPAAMAQSGLPAQVLPPASLPAAAAHAYPGLPAEVPQAIPPLQGSPAHVPLPGAGQVAGDQALDYSGEFAETFFHPDWPQLSDWFSPYL